MDRATAAGQYLLDLRLKQHRVAALPADVVPRSLAEGYEVQEWLVRKLLDNSGGARIGYKIACTSELAQKALGVDAPFFGVLMSHSSHRSPATLRGTDFTVRCAEAEFGFEMAADVPAGPTYTADTIRDFIGAAMPSIEIVDHRYHDWKTVGAPSLLADNAIHGAWVMGEPYAGWRQIDFAKHPVDAGGQRRADVYRLRSRGTGEPAVGCGVAGERVAEVRPPAAPRGPHHDRSHDGYLPGPAGRSAPRGLRNDGPSVAGVRRRVGWVKRRFASPTHRTRQPFGRGCATPAKTVGTFPE